MHKVLSDKKIAIICDWLTNFAGAERVIAAILRTFPHADIFTTVYNPDAMKLLNASHVSESFISHFPFARTKHQMYLPLMPYAFESMNLDAYDIVISSCHACSKGVITSPSTLHICYCHSPMRYLWDHSGEYIAQYGWYRWPFSILIDYFLKSLRIWDLSASFRPDAYVANSSFVASRIKKYYRRDAVVIHPPVDLERFDATLKREPYYLAVGRLIPYKRFDIIVDAFNELELPLYIIGTGKEYESLRRKAHSNITFLGHVSDENLSEYYSRARALIFPQVEDFGITPLEAMASGCPVIAYNEGGARETVTDDVGILFNHQTSFAIVDVVKKYEAMCAQGESFDASVVASYVKKFSCERFSRELQNFVLETLESRERQPL